MAVANPSETEALTLEFELNRSDGTTVASRERTLAPLGHLAIFLFELFEGVEGIAEFEGSMVIRSPAGPQPALTDSIEPPARTNQDSTANAKAVTAGNPVTPNTGGQALPPPRNLSVLLDDQNRLVLSWELPEPPPGGGGSEEFGDETEPNDFDNPDTLEIGQTARGTIDPDFDEDVWRFEGTAGQNIVIDVEAESLDSVLVLFLDQDLDEDGFPDEIGFNDDFGESFDSRLELTLPETSGYLIQIFDAFDEGDPDFFYEMSLSLATNASGSSLDISITLLRNPGDENQTGGLGLSYAPDQLAIDPVILEALSPFELLLNFESLPLDPDFVDGVVTVPVSLRSSPTGVGQRESQIEVSQVLFVEN